MAVLLFHSTCKCERRPRFKALIDFMLWILVWIKAHRFISAASTPVAASHFLSLHSNHFPSFSTITVATKAWTYSLSRSNHTRSNARARNRRFVFFHSLVAYFHSGTRYLVGCANESVFAKRYRVYVCASGSRQHFYSLARLCCFSLDRARCARVSVSCVHHSMVQISNLSFHLYFHPINVA